MNEILDSAEIPDYEINEDNLFVKILVKPRKTIRFIIENCPKKNLTLLLVIGGIYRALDRAAQRGSGEEMSLVVIVLIAIFAGGLFGWLFYYFLAFLLHWTGKWINGKGDFDRILIALAWAIVPSVGALFLYFLGLIFTGDALFLEELPEEPVGAVDDVLRHFNHGFVLLLCERQAGRQEKRCQ